MHTCASVYMDQASLLFAARCFETWLQCIAIHCDVLSAQKQEANQQTSKSAQQQGQPRSGRYPTSKSGFDEQTKTKLYGVQVKRCRRSLVIGFDSLLGMFSLESHETSQQ